jgi:tRNA-dihydrouridine synthase B
MTTSLSIGSLVLESPVLLAPMAGYTDLPFRLTIRSLGGLGLAFTEMLNPTSLLHGRSKAREHLLATCPEDRPLGYQIYDKDPELLARAAQWLVERGAPLIDLNMGCPQKKISRRGAGAGMLKTPARAVEAARRVVESVPVPVTVKMRLGWDNANVAVELAREMEKVGVAAVTVHGRTRMQGFSGKADLDAIRCVVEAVERIPVIANGDIVSPAAAREVFAKTGCAGIMLGREPLKNPWVIRDIARDLRGEPPLPPPSREERLAFLLRHFEMTAAEYNEAVAVVLFRKWVPQRLKGLSVPRPVLAELQGIKDPGEWRRRITDVFS